MDDLKNEDILDIYIHRKGDLPDLKNLNKLENKLFKKENDWENQFIERNKNKFLKDNIKFITRSEIYCDYINKKCPLIKNNNKLYSDSSGHITNNGAKYFSTKSELIIEKLINN